MNQELNKTNNIIVCPRCNEKLVAGKNECSNCGFQLDSKTEVVSNLKFGLNEKEAPEVKISSTNSISIKPTETMKTVRKINNFLLLLVGIVSILLLFMPIYSASNNVWDRIDIFKSHYACPNLSDNLHLHGWSNFVSILIGLIKTLTLNEVVDSVSTIIVIYEFTTLAMILTIAVIGICLLVNAIKYLISGKINYSNKRLLGVNMSLIITLMFAFGCYNAYVIVCLVVFTLTFVVMYINGILSKDKPFLLRNLIHKSICFVLLFTLLILSTVGLVNLNVLAGSDLFHNRAITETIQTPTIFSCSGLFLELTQYIQCFAGDEHFSTIALINNLGNLIFHITYLAFISMAIVSLLKSLTNQSVRFPLPYIIVSTIAYYLFAASTISFNILVNDAAHNYYLSKLSSGIEFETPKVYMLSASMMISFILNLPVCIYCIVARKVCLIKENYYK